jgi:hypothetical protein
MSLSNVIILPTSGGGGGGGSLAVPTYFSYSDFSSYVNFDDFNVDQEKGITGATVVYNGVENPNRVNTFFNAPSNVGITVDQQGFWSDGKITFPASGMYAIRHNLVATATNSTNMNSATTLKFSSKVGVNTVASKYVKAKKVDINANVKYVIFELELSAIIVAPAGGILRTFLQNPQQTGVRGGTEVVLSTHVHSMF